VQVDFRGTPFNDVAAQMFEVSTGPTQVWPLDQAIAPLVDPRIRGTRFADWTRINEVAIATILAEAATMTTNVRSRGGKKVRGHATWDSPEMRLLSHRALILLCAVSGNPVAHIVDRWANVMVAGEFSSPHSHYECDAAVVYSMDPGEEGDPNVIGGNLGFIDPRIPFCCPLRPGRPTQNFEPSMKPGSMIIFPSEFLHYVDSYTGSRPRITLAWNLSLGPIPPEGVRDYSAQDVPLVGAMR
jgi:hypothetical protein